MGCGARTLGKYFPSTVLHFLYLAFEREKREKWVEMFREVHIYEVDRGKNFCAHCLLISANIFKCSL